MCLSLYVIIVDFMSKSYGEGRDISSTSAISYNSSGSPVGYTILKWIHTTQYVDYSGIEQTLRTVQKYHWRCC